MKSRKQRVELLKSQLEKRVLVLDGAMGTAIQDMNLGPKDFGGEHLEGCNEYLSISRPDVVQKIHEDYLKAGADIIETNTFGSTPLVLGEYGLSEQSYELNRVATEIARRACANYETADQPRFVAGSLGPTTKSVTVTGGVTFAELIENYSVQAKGLYDGGADYFLLETCQDTRNIKAGLIAINDLNSRMEVSLPVAVSVTIEAMGTMLAGQNVEALAASLAHVDLLYIGLNCATGPEFMTDHIRSLASFSNAPVACVPNAGLPDENGKYLETPTMLSNALRRFGEHGWINVIGGCCGTHTGHIEKLAQLAKHLTPRRPTPIKKSLLSGIEFLEITEENRPILVGERTNSIGSKKFKDLIAAGKFSEASEIGRAQGKKGAHILDVCLANPDRNEYEDLEKFLHELIKVTKLPLMIDSTDAKCIEMALTFCQGKAIINSINLEDGEERFEKVLPLAKKYGAALVVGTIDDHPEQGMAISRERKLEVAKRSYKLLTEKYGILPQDIYWDPLVFPCATGDANYTGSAKETIEGISLIKKQFPGTKTVLGISNVSFGLPAEGRETLNSVFLYHCVRAGLDLAIVNTEKLKRFNTISESELELAEDLLFNRREDAIAKFAAFYQTFKKEKISQEEGSKLPLEERIQRCIIEGTQEGLIGDLELALKKYRPLEVINQILTKGMDEVGKLFNDNKLIVAEVLQSAEAMKAAVRFLEPFMEKKDSQRLGKMLLATVKGDVHDIGKNLVEIIFSNNGFEILNLGIKIPPDQIISACREHKPDLIGLSGLLVKSAHQMVSTAEDLNRAGIDIPILCGGAALSRNFVDKRIAPEYPGTVVYAQDAMAGLDLAKKIRDADSFEQLKNELTERRSRLAEEERTPPKAVVSGQVRSSKIQVLSDIPAAPDFERHVLTNTPHGEIWRYINPRMLYGRHLGIKGKNLLDLEKKDFAALKATESGQKAFEIYEEVEEFKRSDFLFKPKAVYQFFHTVSEGNKITLFHPDKKNLAGHYDFVRQPQIDGLCLADYVLPKGLEQTDNIAMFVVTAGEGVRARAEELKNSGQYLKSHIIQALALETAEAYAEYLHAKIRSMWGFTDDPNMSMMDRFAAKYRGKRFSFGYPACPNLDDQTTLFRLLKPESIGVELTEGFMMDPEASVSAIVFHHPQATYFGVGEGGP